MKDINLLQGLCSLISKIRHAGEDNSPQSVLAEFLEPCPASKASGCGLYVVAESSPSLYNGAKSNLGDSFG